MQLTGNGEPARVFAARVSASFFPLLGVNAARGRTFLDEENQPGRSPAVILTDAFWRSRTGADTRIVGRTLRLDGQPAVVVGVLPPGFQFDYPTLGIAEPVDLYISYPIDRTVTPGASSNGGGVHVLVIGRLRSGVTLREAQFDMRRVARELTQEHPEAFRGNPQHDPSVFTFLTVPLRDAIVGAQRSLLWLLLAAFRLLLLIACANTAQLLLARSLRRAREVAIRSALGASRLRLIRQFLLEGLVLAVCGGAAGCWPRRMARADSGRAAARAQPAARVGPSWMRAPWDSPWPSRWSPRSLFAMIPAVKGSRWDAWARTGRARLHRRRKPLAPRHDRGRSGAFRIPAVRRGRW